MGVRTSSRAGWLALIAASAASVALSVLSAAGGGPVAAGAAWTIAAALALAGVLVAALRMESGRVAVAWRLWAAGAAVGVVAALTHTAGALAGAAPATRAGEALWLGFAVFGIAGLAFRSPPDVLSFRLFLLDAVPVVLAVAAVIRVVAGGDVGVRPAREALLGLSAVLYALLALVSLQMAVFHRTRNMLLVSGAFCLVSGGTLAWAEQAFRQQPADWPALLLVPGALALGAAGLRRGLSPRSFARLVPMRSETGGRAIPPALAVVTLMCAEAVGPDAYRTLVLGFAGVAFACFTTRFVLVRREAGRSQAALRESERRLRSIITGAAIGVGVTDRSDRTIEANRAFETMLGYGPGELLGQPHADLTHPDDVPESVELHRQLLGGQRDAYQLEKRYRRRDGTFVWARVNVSLLRDAAGEPELVIATVEDVDRRRRAEERLQEAEERFRRLIEHLPLVTYVDRLDDAGSSIYTSPQIEPLLGYSVEEWQSTPGLFVKLLHPDDRERVLAAIAAANARAEPYTLEYRLVGRDGRARWLRDDTVVAFDEQGRPLARHGFLLDISDRRAAEEDLRQTTQALQAIVEASPAAIVGFDGAGNVVMWNPGAERTFGWAALEVLGRFNPLVPEDGREEFLHYVRLALEGRSWRDVEIERRRKDGSPIRLAVSSAPLRDAGGGVFGMVSVLLDISERKLAEEAIRESEERFRTLIENIPGAVYRCAPDADWTMQFISDDIEEISGYPASDFVGNAVRTYASVIHPEDRVEVARLVEAGVGPHEPFIVEYRIVTAGGAVRWVYEKGQPVFDADGRLLWLDGAVFDVTERKHAEQEQERLLVTLGEQNERLRTLDRMKDEFVALVSHELRTPLTSILGYLELLLEQDADGLTDEQHHFLAIVKRNSERLLRLVGDLLFVAQIEAGRLAIERESVDLLVLARDCLEASRPRAMERGVELVLRPGALPPFEGDRVRLAQLLDNLVSNAIKFTPAGGQVRVGLARRNGHLQLSVSDTGFGIPEAEVGRLFERFFRTTAATRHAVQGTGLGLAITKAIVEAHRGTIRVESVEGAGTTFHVELPLPPG